MRATASVAVSAVMPLRRCPVSSKSSRSRGISPRSMRPSCRLAAAGCYRSRSARSHGSHYSRPRRRHASLTTPCRQGEKPIVDRGPEGATAGCNAGDDLHVTATDHACDGKLSPATRHPYWVLTFRNRLLKCASPAGRRGRPSTIRSCPAPCDAMPSPPSRGATTARMIGAPPP